VHKVGNKIENTGLFKMTVVVLTACHTQYAQDSGM